MNNDFIIDDVNSTTKHDGSYIQDSGKKKLIDKVKKYDKLYELVDKILYDFSTQLDYTGVEFKEGLYGDRGLELVIEPYISELRQFMYKGE